MQTCQGYCPSAAVDPPMILLLDEDDRDASKRPHCPGKGFGAEGDANSQSSCVGRGTAETSSWRNTAINKFRAMKWTKNIFFFFYAMSTAVKEWRIEIIDMIKRLYTYGAPSFCRVGVWVNISCYYQTERVCDFEYTIFVSYQHLTITERANAIPRAWVQLSKRVFKAKRKWMVVSCSLLKRLRNTHFPVNFHFHLKSLHFLKVT